MTAVVILCFCVESWSVLALFTSNHLAAFRPCFMVACKAIARRQLMRNALFLPTIFLFHSTMAMGGEPCFEGFPLDNLGRPARSFDYTGAAYKLGSIGARLKAVHKLWLKVMAIHAVHTAALQTSFCMGSTTPMTHGEAGKMLAKDMRTGAKIIDGNSSYDLPSAEQLYRLMTRQSPAQLFTCQFQRVQQQLDQARGDAQRVFAAAHEHKSTDVDSKPDDADAESEDSWVKLFGEDAECLAEPDPPVGESERTASSSSSKRALTYACERPELKRSKIG